jgi:hypothetical protein
MLARTGGDVKSTIDSPGMKYKQLDYKSQIIEQTSRINSWLYLSGRYGAKKASQEREKLTGINNRLDQLKSKMGFSECLKPHLFPFTKIKITIYSRQSYVLPDELLVR